MESLELFEKLANSAHHSVNMDKLIETQNIKIKTAFSENNCELIKKIFSPTDYIANESHVVRE